MKNKIVLILVAAVLALGLVGFGCAEEEAPTQIIIGLARDLDEDLAFFDWCAGGPIYRWYENFTNTAGGITLSHYPVTVPVHMVVRDFSLEGWDLATVTEGLITTDKADFIWGGPGTACIYAQAPVSDLYSKILFTLEGGASYMIWDSLIDGWPYTWVNLSFSNRYQLPLLAQMLKAKLGYNATAYVTYINDTHGYEYRDETINDFGESMILPAGSPPGVPHGYAISQAQANIIIGNAKTALCATPYDVFCAWTYPWNVNPLTQACMNLNFNPPAIVFGPGANFGYYAWLFDDPEQVGEYPPDLVEGIMCFAVANNETVPNVVAKGTPPMTMAEMFDKIAAQIDKDIINGDCPPMGTGASLLDYWGHPCYMAAVQVWEAVVEQVGRVDVPKDIRDALAALDGTGTGAAKKAVSTVFGDTYYETFGLGGGIMHYMCHTGEIGQWQSGRLEIVGPTNEGVPVPGLPNYDCTGNFVYPATWDWIP